MISNVNLLNVELNTDGIFFDLDGTLWDGIDAYVNGFNDFFKANNKNRCVSRSDFHNYMGIEEKRFTEIILPEYNPTVRKKIYKQIIEFQYERIKEDGGVLYEGVREGLTRLANRYKLFIVSNCPEFTIRYFMEWANIADLITDSSAHGSNHRPKHENIKMLINKHHIKRPIYIGDTDSDRLQCDILNIPFGYVSYGFGKSDNYSVKFDSFMQLEKYFLQN